MSMTDPVADMLTRIRNACQARHAKVEIPASKLKREIARVLLEQKFVHNVVYIEDQKQGLLKISLKYGPAGEYVISSIKRVSSPGRRVYVDTDHLPKVLNGMGIAILTTSKGIMTDRKARRMHIGGEVLCYVW